MVKIVVSGIPRGYQIPRENGNWLQEKHRQQIMSVSPDVELVEMPQGEVHGVEGMVEGVEVLLAEGGTRSITGRSWIGRTISGSSPRA